MKLAIIPARGGSKRIPRKNIKEFHGKPIIAYSIEAAINSGCFDKVIVSTDDEEIGTIARMFGAEVPFTRPEELSNDYATTLEVIEHAIRWYEEQGIKVNDVCCIYATAPFLTKESLQNGYEILRESDVNYVFSATSYSFPIQRAIKLSPENSVSMFWPEHASSRSQDLVEAYHDAGQFYWGKAEAFRMQKPIFDNQSKVVLLPRLTVQDIDTIEDWMIAETIYKLTN